MEGWYSILKELYWVYLRQAAGLCEHGDEQSDSMNYGSFFTRLGTVSLSRNLLHEVVWLVSDKDSALTAECAASAGGSEENREYIRFGHPSRFERGPTGQLSFEPMLSCIAVVRELIVKQ
jgi:hypothetical protein